MGLRQKSNPKQNIGVLKSIIQKQEFQELIDTFGCTPASIPKNSKQRNQILELPKLKPERAEEILQVDEQGQNALHWLFSQKKLSKSGEKFVAILLDWGVSPFHPDKNQITPYQLALSHKDWKIMELIGKHEPSQPKDISELITVDPLQLIFHRRHLDNDPYFFHTECRESGLTTMFKMSHFETIYNIVVGLLVLHLIHIMLANYLESRNIFHFEILFIAFDSFHLGIIAWIILYISSFSVILFENLIVLGAPQALGILFEWITIIAMNCFASWWCLYVLPIPPPMGTSFFIMAECMRLNMKMHSYMMSNKQIRQGKAKNENHITISDYPSNLTLSNFFEYTWMPTLIYQTRYPRLEGPIRWGVVVQHFIDFSMSVIYTYALLDRYIYPQIHACLTNSLIELIASFFAFMIPGIMFAFFVFFGLLHSWFNMWAEITRFGDRWFYSDWWNVRSMAAYYRRWNSVVHNFLHRYIYMESIRMGFGKIGGMAFTFLLSAAVHEYLVAVGMGFWRPVLTVLFVGPGLFYIWLTNHMTDWKGWNIFFWANMIIGHGILVSLYSRAWNFHHYEHQHLSQTWLDFINPISLKKSASLFDQ